MRGTYRKRPSFRTTLSAAAREAVPEIDEIEEATANPKR